MEDQGMPSEMMQEIFVRKDPKPLARYKSVSKQLNELITSDFFMKEHLQKMKDLNRMVFILQPECCYVPLFYDDLEHHVEYNGRLIINEDKSVEVVASSNGLVLFCNLSDKFFLLNPISYKTHQLPTMQVAFPDGCTWAQVFFGMGYLNGEDDYKIVRVALFNSPNLNTEVMIYSRNSGTWPRVDDFPENFPAAQPGVFVHGCLHWRSAIFSDHYSITSMNLVNGEYSSMAIPDVPLMFGVQQLVGLNDETLAMSCSVLFLGSPYIIWILKDYFDHNSWTKIQINTSSVLWSETIINLQPLCILKPDSSKILFRLDPVGMCGLYDMRTNEFSLVEAENIQDGYCTVYGFVPSLHSPSPNQ